MLIVSVVKSETSSPVSHHTVEAYPPSAGGGSDLSFEDLCRLSVQNFQSALASGVYDDHPHVELLDGLVVESMSRNPPHEGTLHRLQRLLLKQLPEHLQVRTQSSLTLTTSQPEPDLAVVRARSDDYTSAHPGAGDTLLVIEVSDTTLRRDQTGKLRIYASAGIAHYVIVNLVDRRLQYYTRPVSDALQPAYSQVSIAEPGETLSLSLDQNLPLTLVASDILPPDLSPRT